MWLNACMFTLSQQDTDQRRTWKAKLINTVSVWTYRADNQSAPPACIRESVQKHTTWCKGTVHCEEHILPGCFHVNNKCGMQTCFTLSHRDTCWHANSEAKHPWLEAVSVLLLPRVNKQKIMPFSSRDTCSQPCPMLDSFTQNLLVLTGDAKAAVHGRNNTTIAMKACS